MKPSPTREKADALDCPAASRSPNIDDANDILAVRSFTRLRSAPRLETITASVLAVNSADDERNPPELGIMEREIHRLKHGRYMLIPTGPETRGHGTTGSAKLWKDQLAELLRH